MTDHVTVTSRDFGGCTIVTVPGDVDQGSVAEIHASAVNIDGGHVVLDLGNASIVDPSAATALAALHRTVRARGGGVCFVTRADGVRTSVCEAATDSAPVFFDEIGDALEASMAARQAAQAGVAAVDVVG